MSMREHSKGEVCVCLFSSPPHLSPYELENSSLSGGICSWCLYKKFCLCPWTGVTFLGVSFVFLKLNSKCLRMVVMMSQILEK